MTTTKSGAAGLGLTNKTMLALSACAFAGVAVVQMRRVLARWRATHLDFDFPVDESLFVGWGGSRPRDVGRSY